MNKIIRGHPDKLFMIIYGKMVNSRAGSENVFEINKGIRIYMGLTKRLFIQFDFEEVPMVGNPNRKVLEENSCVENS